MYSAHDPRGNTRNAKPKTVAELVFKRRKRALRAQ